MKLKHELWFSIEDEVEEFLFCLTGKRGDNVRKMFSKKSTLIWTCEAHSHFDAMTQYYEYQGWGEYKTDYPEEDRKTYLERGWIE